MATKKKGNGKAKKAVASKPRAAARYELTSKGKSEVENFGPQQKLVGEQLAKGPRSTAEIASAIESKLETKQSAARVAGFYISTMKADGLVKVVKEAKQAAA